MDNGEISAAFVLSIGFVHYLHSGVLTIAYESLFPIIKLNSVNPDKVQMTLEKIAAPTADIPNQPIVR